MAQVAHWRDELIARSEGITDAWEVTKTYAGRLAEWVLFVCMIINIVEILPGVALWAWVSSAVLGIQAITLDIAGFGLTSMADHARRNGDERAANRAQWTGYLLITIMVVTVSLVTCGSLWPETRGFTNPAEKILILVRVVMTVVYSHVIHGLRRETQGTREHDFEQRLQEIVNQFDERTNGFNQQVLQMESQLADRFNGALLKLQSDLQSVSLKLQHDRQIEASTLSILPELKQQIASIEASTQRELRTISEEVSRLKTTEDRAPARDVKTLGPSLRVLPGSKSDKFDLQSFVYHCLDEDTESTIEAIQGRAEAEGHTISSGSISRYRKQYFEAQLEASNS